MKEIMNLFLQCGVLFVALTVETCNYWEQQNKNMYDHRSDDSYIPKIWELLLDFYLKTNLYYTTLTMT